MGYPRVHRVFNRDVRRRRVATAFNATVSSPLAYSFIPALYVPMDGTHGVSPHTRGHELDTAEVFGSCAALAVHRRICLRISLPIRYERHAVVSIPCHGWESGTVSVRVRCGLGPLQCCQRQESKMRLRHAHKPVTTFPLRKRLAGRAYRRRSANGPVLRTGLWTVMDESIAVHGVSGRAWGDRCMGVPFRV